MIRSFIYNTDKQNWLESEVLLLHDLCALLDEEDNIVYLWNGSKSSSERLEEGYESVVDLISNLPVENPLQLTILTEDIPLKIKEKLDKLLEGVKKEEQDLTERFSHLITIRLYFILGLIGIVLPIIHLLNLIGSLMWNSSNDIAKVSSDLFESWIFVSIVVITITLIAYIGSIIIGTIERDGEILVFSIAAFIICIAILAYLSQGKFLFVFEDNSTSKTYYISQLKLGFFIFIHLIAVAIILLPNLYKFFKFYKTYRDYIY